MFYNNNDNNSQQLRSFIFPLDLAGLVILFLTLVCVFLYECVCVYVALSYNLLIYSFVL